MEAVLNMLDTYIKLDFDVIMDEIFSSQLEEFIIDLNQSQLYDFGQDSEGRILWSFSPSQPYAPFTINIKQRDGLPDDRLTLFQSGEFYDSMTVKYDDGTFIFDADGQKEDSNLFDDYGIDILGLNEHNKGLLAEFTKQLILFYLRQKLMF